jgi:prophage antirepressor-like protein
MSGQENGLPCVQYFYREGRQLRAVALPDETWFSATDVINQTGRNVDEDGAALLLTLMGIELRAVPCADGAKTLLLQCVSESGLTRMFEKMERFAEKQM